MNLKLHIDSNTFNPLKLYDPRKPAGRRTFYWLLAYPILVFFIVMVSFFLYEATDAWTATDQTLTDLGSFVIFVAFVLALARRMLDRERSRWLLLATLIPIIGWMVFLGILIEAFFWPSVLPPTLTTVLGDFIEGPEHWQDGRGMETEVS